MSFLSFQMLFLVLGFVAADAEYRARLKALYRDHTSFSYEAAREIMYNEVDCYDDQIYLLYGNNTFTNWKCHFANSRNPDSNYVNAEHVVPQSTFNEKLPMRSDLHHLISSDSKGNNCRSNYNFGEIADMGQCTKWCKNWACGSSKPSSDIETYSCLFNDGGLRFMPVARERGVVARAVLYFYTVYDEYFTDTATGQTGAGPISLFLKWNQMYPPTQAERERNDRINMTQGNRNPYVDNPALANKAWGEYIK